MTVRFTIPPTKTGAHGKEDACFSVTMSARGRNRSRRMMLPRP